MGMYILGFMWGTIEKIIYRNRPTNEILYHINIIALVLIILALVATY